jgi:hypothetical protein
VTTFLIGAADDFDEELARAELDRAPEHLQRAREAGRRLRYAVQGGEEHLGRKVTKRLERARRLADLLAELASSLRSAEFLQRVGPASDLDAEHNGFTYGLLYEQEVRRAAVLRGALENDRRR